MGSCIVRTVSAAPVQRLRRCDWPHDSIAQAFSAALVLVLQLISDSPAAELGHQAAAVPPAPSRDGAGGCGSRCMCAVRMLHSCMVELFCAPLCCARRPLLPTQHAETHSAQAHESAISGLQVCQKLRLLMRCGLCEPEFPRLGAAAAALPAPCLAAAREISGTAAAVYSKMSNEHPEVSLSPGRLEFVEVFCELRNSGLCTGRATAAGVPAELVPACRIISELCFPGCLSHS